MAKIHPSSVVSSKAQISDDVEIGPFCVVEDDVIIGSGSKLLNHVTIYNHSRIGENNKFFPGTVIGAVPQDIKFDGGFSEAIIGNNNTFRECVTVSRGTHATDKTTIGDNCLFMAYAHAAHDCRIGSNCILANSVALAGHVHVEDTVIIGGLVGIHQFVSIGKHSMIGAHSMVVKDVPPFGLFSGNPLYFEGLNIIGLRRRGFSDDSITAIKKTYMLLYKSGLNVTQALERIQNDSSLNSSEVSDILTFIKNGRRGLSK